MKYLLLCLYTLLFSTLVMAQDENAPSDDKPLTKNQEKSLSTKQQLELANEALLFADSLYDNGAELIKQSKANIKMIESDKKEYQLNYKANKKTLSKTITGDDKAATAKKSSDLKAMDAAYKDKMKKFEIDLKFNRKNIAVGEKLYAKGEEKKAAAKEKIKTLNDSQKEDSKKKPE